MAEFNEKEKTKIETLVEEITKNSIANLENPEGLCFWTTFALSIFLESNNISNLITSGIAKKDNGFKVVHFWLRLLDYDQKDIIVDATIKQFIENEDSKLYIGKKSKNRITKKYKTDSLTFESALKICHDWANLSVNQANQNISESSITKIDQNNLLIASILYYKIKEDQSIINSPIYKFYFSTIRRNLNGKWKNNAELIEFVSQEAKEEYNYLVSNLVK